MEVTFDSKSAIWEVSNKIGSFADSTSANHHRVNRVDTADLKSIEFDGANYFFVFIANE